jgi:hypothetical protein
MRHIPKNAMDRVMAGIAKADFVVGSVRAARFFRLDVMPDKTQRLRTMKLSDDTSRRRRHFH